MVDLPTDPLPLQVQNPESAAIYHIRTRRWDKSCMAPDRAWRRAGLELTDRDREQGSTGMGKRPARRAKVCTITFVSNPLEWRKAMIMCGLRNP